MGKEFSDLVLLKLLCLGVFLKDLFGSLFENFKAS